MAGSGKVEMNNSLKEAVKKSSIHFGNEPVDYKSVVRSTYTHTYIRVRVISIHTYKHTVPRSHAVSGQLEQLHSAEGRGILPYSLIP